MNEKPDIRVEIDPKCKNTEVVIRTDNPQSSIIERIVYAVEHCIEDEYPQITVCSGNSVVLLNQWDIVRIYTENRKLTVCTSTGNYESRLSLSELETMLQEDIFVRISRFEIINLKKVQTFDMTVAGTIKVVLEDGSETWVARRNVRTIQQKLKGGLKGGEKNE